ncbi:hypothetical protein TVTCOM_01990 [Terrisporobacter vanillatitrophus]
MLRGEKLMSTKRKFKRDYIMLEAKDMNYRLKDKVSPKAFAKIEVTDEKSVIALYAENLKSVSEGYSVVAIRSDYETIDLGNFNVNSQGKGEFSLDMGDEDIDIKGIAVIQDRSVPLIGFKGSKIENFEEILFPPQYEFEEVDDDEYEYEEVEYVDVDDVMDGESVDDEDIDGDEEEYEEYEEYEEIEYVEEDDRRDNEYEYEEVIYEEIEEDEYEEVEDEEVEDVQPNIQSKVQEKKNTKSRDDDYIEKKINKAKSVLEKQYTKNSYETVKTKTEPTKTAGTLLMPRQIKKGLKYFREVKPFVADYIDSTRWWKIEINPTTLCGYTMPYLGYVNSLNYTMYSDAVMQSYKYRHYLFGVQYDEYNKRQYYIYAVPGRKNEQPDKGSTGFTRYQACDNRNNSLGYWLCFVDCKARRIVK